MSAAIRGNRSNSSNRCNYSKENLKYYQNEPKFKGVYFRNNLPKIKDGAYALNLNEYKSIGTHWITCEWCYILKFTYISLLDYTSLFSPKVYKKMIK